jgi:N-acetylglucosamine-6-sulfatase
MRKVALLLASLASAVGLCLALLLFTGAYTLNGPAAEAQSATKPNFVFILADDMRKDDLRYMPKTRSLLGRQGKRFSNAHVSYALCCPSRATILRGQYAHNTGIWSNGGALRVYKNSGYERANLATRLDSAGYRTGLFDKYFNGYRETNRVPPGWDDWFAKFGGVYYDYYVNNKRHQKALWHT